VYEQDRGSELGNDHERSKDGSLAYAGSAWTLYLAWATWVWRCETEVTDCDLACKPAMKCTIGALRRAAVIRHVGRFETTPLAPWLTESVGLHPPLAFSPVILKLFDFFRGATVLRKNWNSFRIRHGSKEWPLGITAAWIWPRWQRS
jgi:hypothetical protein